MIRTVSVGLLALALAAPAAAQDQAKKTAKLGQQAPDFTLTDLDGKTHRLRDYLKQKKVIVLEWYNPGCPWVKRVHSQGIPVGMAARLKKQDVVWLAINSGGPGRQGHGKALNQRSAKKWKIDYPILLDETGKVGRLYKARVTPHLYVIGKNGKLVYDGALDNKARPNTPDYVGYVEQAATAAASGKAVATPKTRPYG